MKNLRTKLVTILLVVLALVLPVQAQIPKTVVVDDWEEVALNGIRIGSPTFIGQWDSSTLFIALAVASTTAQTGGTEVIVQLNPLETDELWITQASFTLTGGTSAAAIMSWPYLSASTTTIAVNSTLGLFDDENVVMIFLENQGSPTDSELCTLIGYASNTSITVADDLTNTPVASSTFWDMVHTRVYELPKWAKQVRVIYDNTIAASPTASSVYTHCVVYGTKQ